MSYYNEKNKIHRDVQLRLYVFYNLLYFRVKTKSFFNFFQIDREYFTEDISRCDVNEDIINILKLKYFKPLQLGYDYWWKDGENVIEYGSHISTKEECYDLFFDGYADYDDIISDSVGKNYVDDFNIPYNFLLRKKKINKLLRKNAPILKRVLH